MVVSAVARLPKLLVVEDDLIQMMQLFGLVTAGQAEIVWADDLTRALNAYDLHQWCFNAIVLDGNLRGSTTSVPLAQYVNETGFAGRRIRTSADSRLTAAFIEAGFDLYCAKPYMPEELLAAAIS